MKHTRTFSRLSQRWAPVCLILLGAGCGLIADKDRIVIATVNGENITRGDLEKVLRNMAPDERPIISTKGDVRKALQNYIDTTLKNQLAEKLKKEGKLHVDRAVAERVYMMKHPEQATRMSNPKDYDLTEQDLKYMEEERQLGIDDELKRLEAEQAMYVQIAEDVKSGVLQVSDQEYEEEYNLRKEDLKHFEKIAFKGILVPGSDQGVVAAATSIRGRLAQGEAVEDIVKDHVGQGAVVLESGLANDPANPKYAGFWQQAAGAEPGAILGPIFIQGWAMERTNAQGQRVAEPLPDGLLVCQVSDHVPPVQKTLEEAKPDLVAHILYGKMMDKLREDAKVQVFENKLPDPSMYDTRQSVIQQSQPRVR